MRKTFLCRISILPILVLFCSAFVPHVASGQDSFVISETKLTNSEAESAGDRFGYGVAIDGGTLAVGAPWDDDGADNSGAAYMFRHTDYNYSTRQTYGNTFPQTKLTENGDAQRDDRFGNSLDISGDLLVIGIYKDDSNATDSGSAFVIRSLYDEPTGTWTISEQIRLTSDSGLGDEFGYAVAISGDVVVVGAHKDSDKGHYSGSVYVFRNNGSTWIQEAKLLAGDAQGGERFGSSVALDGDTIVVGATYGGDEDAQTGSVYVFTYNGFDWEQKAELLAEDLGDGDKFGYSVAIEGDIIIAGAPYHDGGESNSGAAYVFRRSAGTWIQEAKLTGSDLAGDDRFGNSVSLSGNTAVVGAYKADLFDVDNNRLEDAGSAYVFRFDGSVWAEEAILIPSDVAAYDEFGYAVAINGDLAVVGAHEHEDDAAQKDCGSAYVFALTPENQPPVAVVGEDQEVAEGDLVTLVGSESYDPDGDELSYTWTQTGGPEVSLDDPGKADPTFTAPAWSAGNETLRFQLVVYDGRAESLPVEVNITLLESTKNVVEIHSVLGSEHRSWKIDQDIYTFHGTQGERVTVTLSAKSGGENNGGDRATLKLMDNIRGILFYRINSGELPNEICATLPATGQYHVLVAGQPRLFRGKRFLGEYTLTLEGTSGILEKGTGSSAVNKHGGTSPTPDTQNPLWNWILQRFSR